MSTMTEEEGQSQSTESTVQYNVLPKRKKKPNKTSDQHVIARMWYCLYVDSKSVFKLKREDHGRIFMTQKETIHLCQDQGKKPSDNLKIIPADPCLPAIGRNALLVQSTTRTSLCRLWQCTSDRVTYMKFLEIELRKGFH